MQFSQNLFLVLGLLLLWANEPVASFTRSPNLSPYTYYRVTITSSKSAYLSGTYIKNQTLGIYTQGGCGKQNCTTNTSCYWNGTWIYEYAYSVKIRYYLYEMFSGGEYQAFISTSPCSSTYLVQSRPMAQGSGMGLGQDFTRATTVNWKNNGSNGFDIKVTPAPAQIDICRSGQSGCTSPNPTTQPTKQPTTQPTRFPTRPTHFPTLPTKYPTRAPTTRKPTNLPTTPTTIYPTTCVALKISGLDSIFHGEQTFIQFRILPSPTYLSDGRSMWSNGRGVSVYFSKRWFPKVGVWVISNGTPSVVQNRTQLTNNAPGTSSGMYGLWDHFVNDNVYQPLLSRITLRTTCMSVTTTWPTPQPTKMPATTKVPTSIAPTLSPTQTCTTLQLISKQSTCPKEVGNRLGGYFLRQSAAVNDRVHFTGVDTTQGSNIFWSDLYNTWVIDGASSVGYSAVALNITQHFLPQLSSWTVVEQADQFHLDCEITFQYKCSSSKYPTLAPTPSPVTKPPTRHTLAPTHPPTKMPTKIPTKRPTRSPTTSPTGAPISKCDGLTVTGTDDGLSQRYQISRTGTIAKRNYWNAVKGDAQVFFSNSSVYNTWVINSASLGIYWLARDIPLKQPPMNGVWDKYLGTSPFLDSSANLTLICNIYWFPTPHPTRPPSAAPTRHPTRHPTASPTKRPTRHPTKHPTRRPTKRPTRRPTRSPTRHPTRHPTNAPTKAPTRSECQYMIVSGLREFDGTYGLTGYDSHNRGKWVKVDDTKKNITYTSSSWVLFDVNENKGMNNSYAVASLDWRPPDAALWHRQYMDTNQIWHQGSSVYITTSCFLTMPPSSAPTMTPTMAPTRSQCVSIFVSSLTPTLAAVPLALDGWYRRQSYLINRKNWWLKDNDAVALEFFDGQWYLREYNTTLDVETMPNRLLTNASAFDDRPPRNATWIYAQYPWASVQISATCHKTGNPTPAPTKYPTRAPTFNRAPQWTFCPNSTFFAFAQNQSEDVVVYWQVPTAKDDQGFRVRVWEWEWSGSSTVEKSWTQTTITSGAALTPGRRYKLVYTATDVYEASSNCTVNIYVINAAPYDSYDSCFQNGFAIDVTVNQDTYSAEDPGQITYGIDAGEIRGQVYWPSLAARNVSCYVNARMLGQVAAKASVAATTVYLGVTAQKVVWQVFILILVVIVLCLFVEAIRRRAIERRNKKKPEAQQSLIRAIDATGDDKDAIMAGVAPAKLLRKTTLQSTLDSGARRPKSEGGTGNTLAIVELAETKPADGDFNISNAPPSPRRPSDNDTTDAAAAAAADADADADADAAEHAVVKAPPVLPQLPKPLFATSVNEEHDDAGGNDAVLNMLEQDWENADGDAGIVDPMALSDPKPPVFSPSQQKQPETGDDMDLGENGDAPEPASEKLKNKRQSELNL